MKKRAHKGAGGLKMSFIPECYADTNLIATILHTGRANHQMGWTKVMNTMSSSMANTFAVGIIDFDKKRDQNAYLKEFHQVAESAHLALYTHSCRPHHIILIKKAIEDFVLACANDENIDLKGLDFGFNHELKSLKDNFKKVTSSKDKNITNLYKTLYRAPEMVRLQNLLTYLKINKYKADACELERILTCPADQTRCEAIIA